MPATSQFYVQNQTKVGDYPFVDAFTAVMPQIGFQDIKRNKISVREHAVTSKGVTVLVGFTKEIKGNVAYNMTENTARLIASTMMMGMPVPELDEMAMSAISELGNMIMGNAATILSTKGIGIDITPPTLCRGDMKISQTYAKNICIPMSSDGSMVLELDIALKGD
jgi:chemotaxis protein CheX